jgi:hypothetical protein
MVTTRDNRVLESTAPRLESDPEASLRLLAVTEMVGAELSTAESVLADAEARLHRVGAGLLRLRGLALRLGVKLELPEDQELASSVRAATTKTRGRRSEGSDRALWLGIQRAAELLDEDPESLRKKLERAARRTSDGHVESEIDGVRGRKFARLWKVQLPPGWASPAGR